MLLSLFCGAGGLDLGFERAGYDVAMAFDIRADSVKSYNHNRKTKGTAVGKCLDIRGLTVAKLDELYGGEFRPSGIIGGPPCQSFSRANKSQTDDDPRHELPFVYAQLIADLNARHPVPFFAFENVTGLNEEPHRERFLALKAKLEAAGYIVTEVTLNATAFGVPQNRVRVILVGLNKALFGGKAWVPPDRSIVAETHLTVRHAIRHLPEPTLFRRGLQPSEICHHPNHWCMVPKSKKFTTKGALGSQKNGNRSFKTLAWDKPSLTVAYGNREVHIHPECHRRLSVYEAMLLQGFPKKYELLGTLSSQITQVSEAVPPPMAEAIAEAIRAQTEGAGAQQAVLDQELIAA
jgi:DNA (cytosine-5)-methyltransferase 1